LVAAFRKHEFTDTHISTWEVSPSVSFFFFSEPGRCLLLPYDMNDMIWHDTIYVPSGKLTVRYGQWMNMAHLVR